MIYAVPAIVTPLSQGDVIDNCPVLLWHLDEQRNYKSVESLARVVVLTQACDLAQSKSARVTVAIVYPVEKVVNAEMLGASAIRDHVRAHRVYGWYFLPRGEPLVDLRDLHTVPRPMLDDLIADGQRRCRLVTPYREHMAQHFSTTYARIALPEPYETQT